MLGTALSFWTEVLSCNTTKARHGPTLLRQASSAALSASHTAEVSAKALLGSSSHLGDGGAVSLRDSEVKLLCRPHSPNLLYFQ